MGAVGSSPREGEILMRVLLNIAFAGSILLAAVSLRAQDADREFEVELDRLIQTLKAGDDLARADAAKEIGYEGSRAARALPALIAALSDPSQQVRSEVLVYIDCFGASAQPAVPIVLGMINGSTSDTEVCRAIHALGGLAKAVPEAATALLALLDGPSSNIRAWAASVTDRAGLDPDAALPRLIRFLERDEEVWAKEKVADTLGTFGPRAKPAVPALVHCLESRDEPTLRTRAAWALAAIGPEARDAVPALLSDGRSPDPDVKAHALYAIWCIDRTHVEEAVASLAAALGRGEPGRDEEHYIALGRMGRLATAAVPRILETLREGDTVTRLNALEALKLIPAEPGTVIEALTRAIADPESCVRCATCETLGVLGQSNEAAVPILLEAVGDGCGTVVQSAFYALRGIGPHAAKALPGLLPYLADGERYFYVPETIAAIGTSAAAAALADALGKHHRADWNIIKALAGMGPAAKVALPALGRFAMDERYDKEDREAATEAVLKIRADIKKSW
jgi:HEAT repeat protein